MKKIFLLQLFAGEEIPQETSGVTPVDAAPESNPDLAGEFESLIKGKYKEQYDTRVQDTVRNRLRSSHETVEKFGTITPALKLLAEHYGVEAEDMEAIRKAVEGDDTFYRRQADAKGMSIEQLRNFRALEQENISLRRAAQQQMADRQALERIESWKRQAAEAREIYPNLDMNVECKSPQFRHLLRSGLDVSTAYLVMHKDELLKSAADGARQTLVNNILATGERPRENGSNGQSASVIRSDVASMTKAEREAIRKRAARGERIRF